MTVLLPCWNAASTIERALASVLDEPDISLECVVVDDGSSDGTADIVQAVADRDPRVVLIRIPTNGGVSNARNEGLAVVRGDWLTFLDADDRLLPGGLAALLRPTADPTVRAVVGQRIWTDGERTWLSPLYDIPDIRRPGRKSIATHPGLMYYLALAGKLVHRSLITDLRFEGRVMGDQPWVLGALLRAGDAIEVIADTVYEWSRPRPGVRTGSILTVARGSARGGAAMADRATPVFLAVAAAIDATIVDEPTRKALKRAYFERLIRSDLAEQVRLALDRRDPDTALLFDSLTAFFTGVPVEILTTSDIHVARVLRPPATRWHAVVPDGPAGLLADGPGRPRGPSRDGGSDDLAPGGEARVHARQPRPRPGGAGRRVALAHGDIARRRGRSAGHVTPISARSMRIPVVGRLRRKPPPPPPRRPPSPEGGLREQIHVAPRRSTLRDRRVNLIVASVGVGSAYGGVQTAIDLFEAVGRHADRRRIISLEPLTEAAFAAFPTFREVAAADDHDDRDQLVSIASGVDTIPVGPGDVFIATFWPTATFVHDVRRWQRSTYGSVPARFAYLIQDFEPSFYPASAQSVLAEATYASPESTIGIYNTTLLQDHFHAHGIRFPHEFTFEPRLSPALRTVPDQPAGARAKRIVVYGRPSKPRNGFGLIVDGLRAWRASHPGAADWTVVSAGERHVDIDLGGEMAMTSLGKLDLSTYATLLRASAVGVSLMISPHPSYPPLEMAELGLLVLTNRFGAKDLSTWHTNITSLGEFTVRGLADDLAALCRRFEADPSAGAAGRSLHPGFLDDGPQFPFADEVAALLRAD